MVSLLFPPPAPICPHVASSQDVMSHVLPLPLQIYQLLQEETGVADIFYSAETQFQFLQPNKLCIDATSSLRLRSSSSPTAAAASSSSSSFGPPHCISAHTDHRVHPFAAVDFETLPVDQLENCVLPRSHWGFTRSHNAEERWRASVYILGSWGPALTSNSWLSAVIAAEYIAAKSGKCPFKKDLINEKKNKANTEDNNIIFFFIPCDWNQTLVVLGRTSY